MFWWNLFLFGILLWILTIWAFDDYWDCDILVAVVAIVYSIGYVIAGALFLSVNDVSSFIEHPSSCNTCLSLGEGRFCEDFNTNLDMVRAFSSSQAMINSFSPEMQAYLGVEEHFSIMAVVVNIIIVAAIVFAFCKWQDIKFTYPFADDYKSFNQTTYRETAIPYKFKVFKSIYNSLIISKDNPFKIVEETHLRYTDDKTGAQYRIHFSYIDYLKYRNFLSGIEAAVKMREDTKSIENVLAFNKAVKEKLKEEGQRPFKDLMK